MGLTSVSYRNTWQARILIWLNQWFICFHLASMLSFMVQNFCRLFVATGFQPNDVIAMHALDFVLLRVAPRTASRVCFDRLSFDLVLLQLDADYFENFQWPNQRRSSLEVFYWTNENLYIPDISTSSLIERLNDDRRVILWGLVI